MKKIITFISITLLLLIINGSAIPVYASETAITGVCEATDNESYITWSFEDGVLTFSGTGIMGSVTGTDTPIIPPEVLSTDLVYRINVEEGITCIGVGCFAGYENLTDVSLPESVDVIRDSAFFDCENLERISFPDSMTSIGECAFQLCISLKSVNLPNGITEISALTFTQDEQLETVIIPDTVTKICNGAFGGCMRLSTVNIPETIEYIDEGAFASCHSLSDIYLGNSLSHIGANAFTECSHLTDVTIPQSTTYVGDHIFAACTSLKKATINCDKIGNYMFANCTELKDVYISDNVKEIGTSAFSNCSNLKRLIIPYNVTSIENDAFMYDDCVIYCYSMEQIDYCKNNNIPYLNVNTPIDISKSLIQIDVNTYTYTGKPITPDCTVIYKSDKGNIILEENFDYTLSYSNNTAPGTASITVNGIGYFDGLTSVEYVINPATTPQNVTNTETDLTENTSIPTKPEANNPSNQSATGNSSDNNSKAKDLYLVGKAYYKITGNKKVTFVKLKNNSYRKITIPNTVKIKKKKYKVTAIANNACYKCSKLTTVNIGNNVTQIGSRAFEKCSKLKYITFGKKVRSLGKRALYNDKKLKKVTFKGTGVKSIGKKTFKNVPRSTNIIVPNSRVKLYLKLINAASK